MDSFQKDLKTQSGRKEEGRKKGRTEKKEEGNKRRKKGGGGILLLSPRFMPLLFILPWYRLSRAPFHPFLRTWSNEWSSGKHLRTKKGPFLACLLRIILLNLSLPLPLLYIAFAKSDFVSKICLILCPGKKGRYRNHGRQLLQKPQSQAQGVRTTV